MSVKVALLGCGRVAQHHRLFLGTSEVQGARVVACCDLDKSKAATMASHFAAQPFTNLDAMLRDSDAELVLVLTPSGLHYEHARTILRAGRHVICEKPITLIPEQCYELAEYARTRGLMYGVIFQNRYNPAVRLLKSAVDEGRFGRIVTATVRLRWCRYQDYYDDGWHGTWALDGGVINQQAIHHVDALNWILGPAQRVCASMARRLNRLEAEDTMVAVVDLRDGILGTIEATTAARPEDFEASLSVVGEKGMAVVGGIALNEVSSWAFVDPRPEDAMAPREHSRQVPTGYGLSHGPMLQDIISQLAHGSVAAPVSALDAVKAVELVHACYASCEQSGWVALVDKPRSKLLGFPVNA
jgi:UDP-N-acetyl-2-amino-2-deoxyglucuronate dehydrogenase